MTNSETLNLRCIHHTKLAWTRNTLQDTYPAKLCRRIVQQILRMERWSLVQQTLQRATASLASTSETETSVERDQDLLSTVSAIERRKLELSVRKLHHNCGHPPSHVLVRTLRWKGDKAHVFASARQLRRSACDEAKPPCAKPVSAFQENRKPWRVVGCDMSE